MAVVPHDENGGPEPSYEPFVRPDVRRFLNDLNSRSGSRMSDMSAAQARDYFESSSRVLELPEVELTTRRDFSIPGPGGPIGARLFDARASRAAGPVIIHFHGGAFVSGSLDTHASFCAETARSTDLPVISIDYRRAPEAKWPAAPDDCEAAARWIADSPDALGLDVTGLVLIGDSAGGNLAIVAAMDLRDRPASVPVILLAPIYAITDMEAEHQSYKQLASGFMLTRESMKWSADAYGADRNHHRSSPLRADLKGMPAAVVLVAGLDPLRDQGRAYASALVEAGIPVVFQEAEGTIHGFMLLRKALPSGIADVSDFLEALKMAINVAERARIKRKSLARS